MLQIQGIAVFELRFAAVEMEKSKLFAQVGVVAVDPVLAGHGGVDRAGSRSSGAATKANESGNDTRPVSLTKKVQRINRWLRGGCADPFKQPDVGTVYSARSRRR